MFVQKSYKALFLQYNFDEMLIARTTSNTPYRNSVERFYLITNFRLQSIGLMRKPMSKNMEKIMHNANSNDKILKLSEKNSKLETELKENLYQPKN